MLSCWFSGQFIHVYPTSTGTSFLKDAGAANASMERIERIESSFPTPTHLHTTAQRHATSMWDALSFCLPASSKIISKGHPQCHCSRFSSSSKQDLYMDPIWTNSDQQRSSNTNIWSYRIREAWGPPPFSFQPVKNGDKSSHQLHQLFVDTNWAASNCIKLHTEKLPKESKRFQQDEMSFKMLYQLGL